MWTEPGATRRGLLSHASRGLAGLALTRLLVEDGLLTGAGRRPDHAPTATRVVQLFMSGAASQCDLFDHKPLLIERAGEPWDPGQSIELFQSAPGVVMPSPFGWRRTGESGRWMSGLVPRLAERVDDLAFIHSMTSRSNVHGPATFLASTGFTLPGFPSAGAWVGAALGSANRDLPTFVALPDVRGLPPGGPKNWAAGFLPAQHQGTAFQPSADEPVSHLFPPAGAGLGPGQEDADRALLRSLDERHAAARPGDARLEARVRSYELAARMQLSCPEALDLGAEPRSIRELYGLDDPVTADFGRRCLVARRLLERGVRFVQVWSGADNGFPRRNWDSHEDLERDHRAMGRSMDRPAAALVQDLKQRGLLEDTIVHWTTEFGRMPCSQGGKGRDHNPDGFTSWLAGGGIAGGRTFGATDEWSWRAVDRPVEAHDVHATLLHCLGYDHERLTVRSDGIDRRLTDVHGRVLHELLA
jgi:hypothetical protein